MPRRRPTHIRAELLALAVGLFAQTRPVLAQESPRPAEPTPGISMTPAANVARGMAYYDAGQFNECAASLASALDERHVRQLDARETERARVYYGACLIAMGNTQAADEQFRKAIRQNPQMAIPSTIVFPQEVVDRFILVRSALLEEIRAAQEKDARRAELEAARARAKAEEERRRIQELERLAFQVRIVEKNERWVAWVPFGVGQFQNRDRALGGLFLATEALLAATAIGGVSVQLSLHSQANDPRGRLTPEETEQLNQNLRVAHTVSLVAAGTFLATALIGIAEANMSFVPEFDAGTRRRPPGVKRIAKSVTPAVLPYAEGAGIGLSGRF